MALGTETGGYSTPSIVSGYFGSGTSTINTSGNVFNSMTVASPGISPAATGADNVLAVFSIPANTFDGITNTNRGLTVTAIGSVGSSGGTKRIKIIYNPTAAVVGSTVSGGTTIADTGALTTTTAVGWSLTAQVFKYGAPNSNTQLAIHQAAQVGSTVSALLAPIAVTAIENTPTLIAVTGNAGTTTSDIQLNFFEPNASN
jgi:hypothetical protein